MVVELGPYPLCDRCQETNGGLVSVRHRQIHVRMHGKESCVDQGLARAAGCTSACPETYPSPLFLAVVWPATLLAAWATDRSPAWMAAAAIVSLYAVGLPIGRLTSVPAETWIGRTRVTRSAPRGVDDAGLLRPLGPELERVRAAIAVARSVVGSVVRRHRKGSRGLLWTDDRGRVVRCLAEADLALRMASDAIDYWLSLPRG